MNKTKPQKSPKPSFLISDKHDLTSSLLTADTSRRSIIKQYPSKKIIILGRSNTGKSSILLKFLYGFPDVENIEIEENHYTPLRCNHEDYLLHIVDVADLDEYTPLYASKYSAKVDGYIFVYTVDDRQSFNFVQKLREKLYDFNRKEVPFVLVANKSDRKQYREVATEEGRNFARLFQMPYIELSAQTHSNEVIKKIFESSLKEILKAENLDKNLKFLKNWDEDRVESLLNIFSFACLLIAIIGLFFAVCSLTSLSVYSDLTGNEEATLILLIINGFFSITLSLLSYVSIKTEKKYWLTTSTSLSFISLVLDVLVLYQIYQGKNLQLVYSQRNCKMAYVILNSIVLIHIVILVVLGVLSWLSNEIMAKRRNSLGHRFAALKI